MVTPASQSTVWLIEEKHLPELRLSLFEYSIHVIYIYAIAIIHSL